MTNTSNTESPLQKKIEESTKHTRKKLETLTRILKSDYYDLIIEEAGTDTRKLWGIINELIDRKQCRHKMPNRFIIDGKSVRDKNNIAEAFNIYFSSIGTVMANQIPDTPGYESYLETNCSWVFELSEMTEKGVLKIMKEQ